MTEPRKSDWLSPPAILGIVGMLAATGMAYSRFDGRVSVAEANTASLEKRLERLETKLDFLVGQAAKGGE
jgi:hypothetical protein